MIAGGMPDTYDYDVFLSYNSANREVVEGIAKQLRGEHGLRVFFDAYAEYGELQLGWPAGRHRVGGQDGAGVERRGRRCNQQIRAPTPSRSPLRKAQ